MSKHLLTRIHDWFLRRRFDNRRYWDYRYRSNPELGSGAGSRGEVLAWKRKLVRMFHARYQPGSILDVGCGDLALGSCLPPAGYTGIDVAPSIIERNRERYPDRRFLDGDFLALEIMPAEFVMCFDVLIHQRKRETYEAFVAKLVRLTQVAGLVSGYNELPERRSSMTFYHEPLAATLERNGVVHVCAEGRYHQVTVFSYQSCPDDH